MLQGGAPDNFQEESMDALPPLPRGWYPVGGVLQEADNGRGPNLPGTPSATVSVPGMWHIPVYRVACGPLTGATCHKRGVSVGETPFHRRTADVLYFIPKHGGTAGLPRHGM